MEMEALPEFGVFFSVRDPGDLHPIGRVLSYHLWDAVWCLWPLLLCHQGSVRYCPALADAQLQTKPCPMGILLLENATHCLSVPSCL